MSFKNQRTAYFSLRAVTTMQMRLKTSGVTGPKFTKVAAVTFSLTVLTQPSALRFDRDLNDRGDIKIESNIEKASPPRASWYRAGQANKIYLLIYLIIHIKKEKRYKTKNAIKQQNNWRR